VGLSSIRRRKGTRATATILKSATPVRVRTSPKENVKQRTVGVDDRSGKRFLNKEHAGGW